MSYDPYPYNPIMRNYYGYGHGGLSEASAKLANDQPELAQHINSVNQFVQWIKAKHPEAYAAIANRRPDLLDAGKVVSDGLLNATGKTATVKASGMRGLEDEETSETGWGQQLLETVKNVLPAYYSAQAQKQILDLNIARAEKGLPPIDSASIAPTVNVGVSGDIQKLGYLAVGGLVLVGLLSAFKKR